MLAPPCLVARALCGAVSCAATQRRQVQSSTPVPLLLLLKRSSSSAAALSGACASMKVVGRAALMLMAVRSGMHGAFRALLAVLTLSSRRIVDARAVLCSQACLTIRLA